MTNTPAHKTWLKGLSEENTVGVTFPGSALHSPTYGHGSTTFAKQSWKDSKCQKWPKLSGQWGGQKMGRGFAHDYRGFTSFYRGFTYDSPTLFFWACETSWHAKNTLSIAKTAQLVFKQHTDPSMPIRGATPGQKWKSQACGSGSVAKSSSVVESHSRTPFASGIYLLFGVFCTSLLGIYLCFARLSLPGELCAHGCLCRLWNGILIAWVMNKAARHPKRK